MNVFRDFIRWDKISLFLDIYRFKTHKKRGVLNPSLIIHILEK